MMQKRVQNFFDYIQPSIIEHGIVMRDMLVMRYMPGD